MFKKLFMEFYFAIVSTAAYLYTHEDMFFIVAMVFFGVNGVKQFIDERLGEPK